MRCKTSGTVFIMLESFNFLRFSFFVVEPIFELVIQLSKLCLQKVQYSTFRNQKGRNAQYFAKYVDQLVTMMDVSCCGSYHLILLIRACFSQNFHHYQALKIIENSKDLDLKATFILF